MMVEVTEIAAQAGSHPAGASSAQHVLIDSGSEIHVCPRSFRPDIPVQPAKTNLLIRSAGGHVLRHHGQKVISLALNEE
eukprot:2255319-Amphidinium_carterae.1